MPRTIEDSVVVVTGASSGIGRATAHAFAREGARVVLAARRKDALEEAAEECRRFGARAVGVPTDVTDEDAVKELARKSAERFGRIDTWVNNAAVALFARFEEAPSEAYRKVFDTNFFGTVHGARAVLPWFRERGTGVLINMSSVVAAAPQPYTSAYVASKYAIRGFSECLRMELALDGVDIHVVHMMPASIDTPLFQHAANYTGRAVKAMDPVVSPHRVADATVQAARSPSPEMKVGMTGRLFALQAALRPVHERLGSWKVDRDHFQKRPAPPSEGNLFEPSSNPARVEGGWAAHDDDGSGKLGKAAVLSAALAVPLAVWGWTRHRRR